MRLKRFNYGKYLYIIFSALKQGHNLHGYFWHLTQWSRRYWGNWKMMLLCFILQINLIRWWKITWYSSKWRIVGFIFRYNVEINWISIKQQYFLSEGDHIKIIDSKLISMQKGYIIVIFKNICDLKIFYKYLCQLIDTWWL